jgi:hypothetical protein
MRGQFILYQSEPEAKAKNNSEGPVRGTLVNKRRLFAAGSDDVESRELVVYALSTCLLPWHSWPFQRLDIRDFCCLVFFQAADFCALRPSYHPIGVSAFLSRPVSGDSCVFRISECLEVCFLAREWWATVKKVNLLREKACQDLVRSRVLGGGRGIDKGDSTRANAHFLFVFCMIFLPSAVFVNFWPRNTARVSGPVNAARCGYDTCLSSTTSQQLGSFFFLPVFPGPIVAT